LWIEWGKGKRRLLEPHERPVFLIKELMKMGLDPKFMLSKRRSADIGIEGLKGDLKGDLKDDVMSPPGGNLQDFLSFRFTGAKLM